MAKQRRCENTKNDWYRSLVFRGKNKRNPPPRAAFRSMERCGVIEQCCKHWC